jgi:hypothetical protein
VVLRGGEERGEPREVEIGGAATRLDELLEQLGASPTGATAA